jgi:hypothetical protein
MERPLRGGDLKLLATPASASVKAIVDFFDAGRNGGFLFSLRQPDDVLRGVSQRDQRLPARQYDRIKNR